MGFQGLGLDLGLSLGSSDPEAGVLPVTLATFNQIGCVLAVTTDTPYGKRGRGVKRAQQRSVCLSFCFLTLCTGTHTLRRESANGHLCNACACATARTTNTETDTDHTDTHQDTHRNRHRHSHTCALPHPLPPSPSVNSISLNLELPTTGHLKPETIQYGSYTRNLLASSPRHDIV